MTFLDWAFVVVLAVSMVVGVFRGFVKEAVSVGSLLIAVWAAFHFAPVGMGMLEPYVSSNMFRVWIARIAIFSLVLMLGGLAGWAISRFINQVGMTPVDRTLGLGFGFLRGAIICGLIVIVGPYVELDEDQVWKESSMRPYVSRVADLIVILAPRALDYLRQEFPNPEPPPAEPPVTDVVTS